MTAFVSDHCRVVHDTPDVSLAVAPVPLQSEAELIEIVGASGAAVTSTGNVCDVALQPFASVVVTQYEVVALGESVIRRVVTPFDQL